MTTQTTAWNSLLSRVQRRDAKAYWVLIWGILSSVLLILMLGIIALFVDLCASKGQISLSADEQMQWLETLQQPITSSTRYEANDYGVQQLTFEDTGLLSSITRLKQPVLKTLLTQIYNSVPSVRFNAGLMTWLLGSGLFVGLLRLICYRMATRMSEQSARQIADLQRRQIHRHALRLGPGELDDHAAGHVVHLFKESVEQVSQAVQRTFTAWGISIAQVIVLVSVMLFVDWRVTLQCLPIVALFYYVIIIPRALEDVSQTQLNDQSLNRQMGLLGEDFEKARIIRGYAIEQYSDSRFAERLTRFEDMQRNFIAQAQNREWFIGLLIAICLGLVGFLMGMKVLLSPETPGSLSLSGAILIGLCIWQLHVPTSSILTLKTLRHSGELAAEQIARFLQTKPEVAQAVGAKFIEPLSRFIQLESVSYQSPLQQGRPLLDQIELRIPAKQVTSIVGMKPIEAKALAYLLPRFIEPQTGRVLYDGEDIAWSTLESLRAETLYVGGDAPLFTGTVLENLMLGDEKLTLNKVTEAAKMVHAHQFIQKLPQGYESQLGQHGEELDAGQVFRLCLARAALRNPAVLIVEEPEAEFDEDTKAILEDTYNRLFQNRTVILLPYRLSSLKGSDQIALLSHGKVEAMGSHADMLANVPLYRHWEYTRFNVYRHDED